LNIDGYKLYRADRTGRKHTRGRYSGGAAIYMRSDLAATTEKLLTYSNGVVEAVVVHSHKENLLVCSIYRQPDDLLGNHRSGSYELSQALTKIGHIIDSLPGTPDIVISGDFNIPNINWTELSTNNNPNSIESHLVSFQNNFFL